MKIGLVMLDQRHAPLPGAGPGLAGGHEEAGRLLFPRYPSVGQVIDVAPDVTSLRQGDLVACGGLSASHAEIVSVPVNLCGPLPPDADLKKAAYINKNMAIMPVLDI